MTYYDFLANTLKTHVNDFFNGAGYLKLKKIIILCSTSNLNTAGFVLGICFYSPPQNIFMWT